VTEDNSVWRRLNWYQRRRRVPLIYFKTRIFSCHATAARVRSGGDTQLAAVLSHRGLCSGLCCLRSTAARSPTSSLTTAYSGRSKTWRDSLYRWHSRSSGRRDKL